MALLKLAGRQVFVFWGVKLNWCCGSYLIT